MNDVPHLRAEIRSVCRFLDARRRSRPVRPMPRRPLAGILADLADPRSMD